MMSSHCSWLSRDEPGWEWQRGGGEGGGTGRTGGAELGEEGEEGGGRPGKKRGALC
jgi:hypothetical protein